MDTEYLMEYIQSLIRKQWDKFDRNIENERLNVCCCFVVNEYLKGVVCELEELKRTFYVKEAE